jgi:hypothetical protein
MVWVSNQSSGIITITITNASGGSAVTYEILSKDLENWGLNYWYRKGDETATVKLANGKTTKFQVGPQQFIKVYDDTIAAFEAPTTHFS